MGTGRIQVKEVVASLEVKEIEGEADVGVFGGLAIALSSSKRSTN